MYENGRRYHAYREGEYPLPNDEQEQERLNLLHHIFRMLLGGGLFRSPISSKPQRILDFGTGTGIWAVDIADEFPSAEVIGTDLSAIQPGWVPPNCKFYVDDAESDWSYTFESFDFIHGRGMAGGIKNWDRLYEQIYRHLKPGGWVEMQEYEGWVRSDDGSLENAKPLSRWQEQIDEASTKFGKKLNIAETHKQKLLDAGFVNVRDDVFKVCWAHEMLPFRDHLKTDDDNYVCQCPISTWPKDPKFKEIGRYQLGQALESVESFTVALFTRVLGYSREEAQLVMAQVRADLREPKNHFYVNYHFIYGQKPDRAN